MTKQEIANTLIEAGLDRFLVDSFWQAGDCFVSDYDLGNCKTASITKLMDKADHLITDKGIVFQAKVAA